MKTANPISPKTPATALNFINPKPQTTLNPKP